MAKTAPLVYPRTEQRLHTLGEQIKLARLRRGFTASLIAERAGITRSTLLRIEKGSPSVSIGAYAAVLSSIGGLDKDLLLVAAEDEVGRTYQDLGLLTKKRGKSKISKTPMQP